MAISQAVYPLSEMQVTTPQPVISLFWRLTKQHRERLGTVLDMGAGDCRFANGGFFERYVGVEIDPKRVASAVPPANGQVIQGCVFRHEGQEYDACIGNPPYVRHHHIASPWKEDTAARLERELSVTIDRHCNLYIYFFCLALLKTSQDGLVALVIPYEWASRPSANPLRQCIQNQGWDTTIYRFQKPIFEGVLTTASVSIVDKSQHNGHWEYYDITPDYQAVKRRGVTGSRHQVLDYAARGTIWALRGLSPGSQRIFTLTEGQRVRAGLSKQDVVPCVTTLRRVPRSVQALSPGVFQKRFVRAGERCWLIRSHEQSRSPALDAYLDAVPEEDRKTYTCRNQRPWHKYLPHPVPQMLFASGFTQFGPKVLINSVGARAVGSVWGINSNHRLPLRRLQAYLLKLNFEERVVAHAKTLKKVEVRQLNAVLNTFARQEKSNGRHPPR